VVAAGQFFRPSAAESTMAWSKFGSFKAEKGDLVAAVGAVVRRRDPYEVLRVERNATEQEIKSAFRRMALK
jgi:DnaJ-class molecular chaperone